jgi:hypothetical protein
LTAQQHQAQVDWEARVGRPAAAAAALAAVFSLASVIVQATAFRDSPDGDRGTLVTVNEQGSDLWLAVGLRCVSLAGLGFVLYYLLQATRYRRPMPAIIAPLVYLGPLLLVVGSIITQLDLANLADDFTSSGVIEGRAGEERAEDLLDDRSPVGLAVASGGTLALALALVFVSLNAMRAGLLSRFMGILGVIAGALLVLPLSPIPIVQIFWLGALAALFLGRWPNGRGPAWEAGEGIPWPSAAELRERSVGDAVRSQFEGPEDEPEPEAEPAEGQPASRRRKRKRRR